MGKMYGLKKSVKLTLIAFALLSVNSCDSSINKTQEDNFESINKKQRAGDNSVYLEDSSIVFVNNDFENLKSRLYLSDGNILIDSFAFRDCYGNGSKVELINNGIIKISSDVRGGIGVVRKSESFFFVKRKKLTHIFTKIVQDSFHDEMFDLPSKKYKCDITFMNDTVYLHETEYQDSVLIMEIKSGYDLEDLKNKKDTIIDFGSGSNGAF